MGGRPPNVFLHMYIYIYVFIEDREVMQDIGHNKTNVRTIQYLLYELRILPKMCDN